MSTIKLVGINKKITILLEKSSTTKAASVIPVNCFSFLNILEEVKPRFAHFEKKISLVNYCAQF